MELSKHENIYFQMGVGSYQLRRSFATIIATTTKTGKKIKAYLYLLRIYQNQN